jgi:uncharacterized SAM-dependent methyltransferase
MEKQIEINEIVFKELIKRGYSLEGKTRIWNIADSKLWYLTQEQAKTYLNLENSERLQKNYFKTELDLISKNISDIRDLIEDKTINIIDLGCGSGKKAARFIKNLNEKKEFKIRYCPVDINSNFVSKAIETVRAENPNEIIKMQWVVSDFENIESISKLLRYKEYQKNVFLLLGNTLENLEIHETLYQIRRAMNDGDILIIGDGLDTKNKEELLHIYSSEKIEAFLDYIPEELGFNKKEFKIIREFKNSRVEISYELKVNKKVIFSNKEINFNAGDRLLVFFSYKYDKDDMISFTKMYFDDVEFFTDKKDSYALIVCKK